MIVKELIEALQKLDPDLTVVMSRDPEGNSYSELDGAYAATWDPAQQEVGIAELTEELVAQGYGAEDVKLHPAVCLWPKH